MKISSESLNTIADYDCALLMIHLIMVTASVPPEDVPWFTIFSDRLDKVELVN